ncbi:zinc ribbon domain-containing protein [candidate division TA06 bacterium]|uniref:Zinc ribbon domain-containing protein n=1 Tax=candidate division TA06 bacterium TaxID=2250710 RepID=A0A933I6X2_UNCT6|nr:zinc ribbon domain-containing protein [candidate division TA06 bacterium]
MPTYEYQCRSCGSKFSRQQAISEDVLKKCPACGGEVDRLITGGSGFIMKGGVAGKKRTASGCSLETTGRTCCGRDQRCGKPECGDNE